MIPPGDPVPVQTLTPGMAVRQPDHRADGLSSADPERFRRFSVLFGGAGKEYPDHNLKISAHAEQTVRSAHLVNVCLSGGKNEIRIIGRIRV